MSKSVLIIIIAAFLLIIGIMGFGFFFMWKTMNNAVSQVQQQNGETVVEEEEVPVEEVTIGPIYKLDTLIVNLADQGGKRYLRVTMELELKPAQEIEVTEVIKELENRMPQIRDAILMILPSKQYADIANTQGKIALRDELIEKINAFLKKGQITTIYFTEFVVQ